MKKNTEHGNASLLVDFQSLISNVQWRNPLALALILGISIIAYLPVFHNNFLNWDDPGYITNNPLITSFNLSALFSTNVLGNYHPLTMLVYTIEYQLFGLNPAGYHAFNLLLHLLNVMLVYYTVKLLAERSEVALVASLLFGIHPLHVESIAWAAETKDLLYGLFFLSSYLLYLKYLHNREGKFLIYALVLFLFSLLSKAMAASLPLVMLLTDYFKGRSFSRKVLIEKAPFFLLSFIFGIVAILAQKSSGFIEFNQVITFPQRIVFAAFGFMSYLIKLVLPQDLSAFYSYPSRESGIYIPGYFYLYLFSFVALVGYLFTNLRKNKKLIFGLGFFTLTLLLVLQLLPVGKAIMADRYSYLPSIGIFYLAGEGFALLVAKKQKWPAFFILAIFTLFFSLKTYSRSGEWKNDLTLWGNEIGKDLAQIYPKSQANGNENSSVKGFEKEPQTAAEYLERATLNARSRKYPEALSDLDKSMELDSKNANAYLMKGILLVNLKNEEQALAEFTKAINLKSDFSEAFNNRGIVYLNLKRYQEANSDFDQAIALQPKYALAYCNKGNVYFDQKLYSEAIGYFSKAVELKEDFAQAFYYKGLSESYTGKSEQGCSDLEKAFDLGYMPAAEAISKNCGSYILKQNKNVNR